MTQGINYNEPLLHYAVGSSEREGLQKALEELKRQALEIPQFINGKEIYSDNRQVIHPPHELAHTLGYFHKGTAQHVQQAIDAALKAKNKWMNTSVEERCTIFSRAAELLATKYRFKINAATMLCQSKNAYQAEIDSACELIDFLRIHVHFYKEINTIQPYSPEGIHNYSEYRPLEGFVLAITPFNFTAIAGNLPTAPALMGNTVVWKPAFSQIYSAWVIMQILQEAGLPDGVINLIYTEGPETGDVVFTHPEFGGLHYTGSTHVFDYLWKTISDNLPHYKSYPRIVGETGGKDFVLAHPSANVQALSIALIRGAYEFQGQKCSAASRAYLPKSIWDKVKETMLDILAQVKTGSVEDFSCLVNAVIDEIAFDKIMAYIEHAHQSDTCNVLAGGTGNKENGYFIQPTLVQVYDPKHRLMQEEIFGPVLSVYVYEDHEFEETLQLVNSTSPYALTGALFAEDEKVIEDVLVKLRFAAGNFYINDKPTGAVVNQQPFGGARRSGTNDKAGSMLNLLRWTSPRSVKRNFDPPHHFDYPFMK
ncbi:MAG TPA: L-glutamate gamma-semialdehyde dehydrogenase [Cytophagaceae bacterium]|jgi:1-pyrroline-5-carboxylate dehydrogenase|nr:L-glutamate gamma-semialdehyde dehydrogenase [Cytophagaceae bacterium]